MSSVSRWIREPLFHFLVLGAALFAVFSVTSDRDQPGEGEIVVSAGKIEHLTALFARTWQRPPTRQELEGLINDYVREEAAYRRGMAMGLDQDDTIIRRRIRQKLDFIADDLASLAEPTEEELAAYLAEHPEDFRVDPSITFRHVFLNPDKRGDALETDTRDLLVALNADPSLDSAALGDRILLESRYLDVSTRGVAGLFGQAFATAIAALQPGAWQGPIESGYGVHLVLIDERTPGRVPELAEVRGAVLREWNHRRRGQTIEQFYRDILEGYEVIIERPPEKTKEADP